MNPYDKNGVRQRGFFGEKESLIITVIFFVVIILMIIFL